MVAAPAVGGRRLPILLLANCLNTNGAAILGGVLHGRRKCGFTILIGSVNRIGVSTRLVTRNNIIARRSSDLMTLRGKYVYYALGISLTGRLYSLTGVRRFSCVIIRTDNVYRPLPVTRAVYSVPLVRRPFINRIVPILSYVTAIMSTGQVISRFSSNSTLVGSGVSRRSVRGLIVRRVRFYGIVLLGGSSLIASRREGCVASVVRTLRPATRIVPYSFNGVSLDGVINAKVFSFGTITASTT